MFTTKSCTSYAILKLFVYANLCGNTTSDVTSREASFAVYFGIVAVFKVFNMYCSVYGCTSDSQKNPKRKIHFFRFPKATNKEEKKRRDIEAKIFCSLQFHVCSLHFSSDAYILSHSPAFLQSINFSGKRKLILKSDAVPTENKSLDTIKEEEHASESKRRQTGTLSRKKVSMIMRFL